MASTVIVFGPTGNIGSVAARSAQQNGAKVILAMRDVTKSIRGLSSEDEKQGGFERVQADLTKPDTVAAAVKQTGATRAFIYLAHGSSDHMKASIEALKTGGINFVVFLSSFTVAGELEDFQPSELIPYIHAQVEINLRDIFGEGNYVAVRPGAFATNTLSFKDGISSGVIKTHVPDAEFDFITPLDMGRVSGTILVNGSKDGDTHVYLFGPKMVSRAEAIKILSKVFGKELEIVRLSDEETLALNKQQGMPDPISNYLVKTMREREEGQDFGGFGTPGLVEQGIRNVEKYSGHPAQSYEDWAISYKDQFQ